MGDKLADKLFDSGDAELDEDELEDDEVQDDQLDEDELAYVLGLSGGKAMKAMAAMKAMKAMKKAMKVSKIAKGKRAKASVFLGGKVKTTGGLKKADLMKSKSGKIVSKKASAAGKKAYKNIQKWTIATSKARKALGLKGFVPIKKGTPLYIKAKSFFTS